MDTITGYAGRQLRLDLDGCKTLVEPVSPEASRKYIGGVGYAARLIYDEMTPRCDPLAPASLMVLATGPLSLNQVPGGGSLELCFKSPLTGAWGESRVGGDFGPALKKAGFDYVIISGRSPEPVYVVIQDGRADFRSASHLLGKNVSEKCAAIRADLGGRSWEVLCIGPAGENQVKIASVMSDDRAAGRCGPGAVWGAKNLIAVAVKGSGRVKASDPESLKKVTKGIFDEIRENPMFVGLQSFGTIGDLPGNDDGGDWPTKNWQSNSWGKGPELYAHYESQNFIEGFGCYKGCTIACARRVQVTGGAYATPVHGGAEYESISCFTAYLLNEDMDAAIHCDYLCNEYGLDTISTGAVISFALECAEKGLLADPDPALCWGNAAILPGLVTAIAHREGIGDLLAEGVRGAVRKLGAGAEPLAIHVKGLEGPAHDPRSGKALGVTYATGNRGMCHIHPLEGMAWDRGKLDWGLGKYGVVDPNTVERWDEADKGAQVALLQNGLVLPDILGTCKFYMYAGVTLDHIAQTLKALTGWDLDGFKLLEIGERVINLQRLFNLREGITVLDDCLPDRVRALPAFGKYCGEEACAVHDLEGMLREYYQARGWDPETGWPLAAKLAELGLD